MDWQNFKLEAIESDTNWRNQNHEREIHIKLKNGPGSTESAPSMIKLETVSLRELVDDEWARGPVATKVIGQEEEEEGTDLPEVMVEYIPEQETFSNDAADDPLSEEDSHTEVPKTNTKKRKYPKESRTCEICKKVVSKPSYLKEHRLIHKDTKPYECETCHKTFRQRCGLVAHKRIHDEERPFQCDKCGMGFKDRSTLIRHKMIHNGVRPYKCKECERSFTKSSNLISHERTHTGEKPYKCAKCGMAFSQTNQLKLHIKKESHG